jgi:hypothetical protein
MQHNAIESKSGRNIDSPRGAVAIHVTVGVDRVLRRLSNAANPRGVLHYSIAHVHEP